MFNDENYEKLAEAIARMALSDYLRAWKKNEINAMRKIEKDFKSSKVIACIIADPEEFFDMYKNEVFKNGCKIKIRGNNFDENELNERRKKNGEMF